MFCEQKYCGFWEKCQMWCLPMQNVSDFDSSFCTGSVLSIVTLDGKKERTRLYTHTYTQRLFHLKCHCMALGASEQKITDLKSDPQVIIAYIYSTHTPNVIASNGIRKKKKENRRNNKTNKKKVERSQKEK